MSIYSTAFWKATSERVVSSTAGGALAAIGSGAFGVINADWQSIGSLALGAGVVSLLKALVTGAKNGTASVGGLEQPAPRYRDPNRRV